MLSRFRHAGRSAAISQNLSSAEWLGPSTGLDCSRSSPHLFLLSLNGGIDASNLRYMRLFYKAFPIRNALRNELSWTHFRNLDRERGELAGQIKRYI